jgi:hypothetical protein
MNKETENANPFEGFISESAIDGVAVKPVADKAAPADAAASGDKSGGVPEGRAKADAAGDDKADKEADKGGDEGAEIGEETEELAEENGGDEAAKEPAKKPKKDVNTRIGELTRARRGAERRAADLERRLADLEAGKSAVKAELTDGKTGGKDKTSGPPKAADYMYGELDSQYIADLVTYQTDQRLAAHEAKQAETRRSEAAAKDAQKFTETTEAVYAKGAEKFEDFQEVVLDTAAAETWHLSKTLGDLVLASDLAPEMLYHLASNPKEANQIFAKSPAEQGAYFGRLEARLKAAAKPPAKEKEPKEPLAAPLKQPKGAGGKFSVSPDTDDFAAFEALGNKALQST